MIRTRLVPGVLALVLLAACGDTPTGGVDGGGAASLTRAEAEELAPDWETLAGDEMGGMALPSFSVSAGDGGASFATVTTTSTMTRTRTCPAGGSVRVVATATHTFDRETRTGTHQGSAVRTDSACAMPRRAGATLTITGNPNVQITSSASFTNGVPGVRTVTHKGSFSWTRSTGQSGTCSVDLTSTWTPATRTHTVKGTFCNQTVDITRTRTGGPSA